MAEHTAILFRSPASEAIAPLGLQLLGTFRCICDGRDITPRGRKARALLAFLALANGRCASREKLAALLWTDRGQEQARASLRQTLAELKTTPRLNLALTISRETVELVGDGLASDCLEIPHVARSGDLAALARLLDPVGGDLLEDLSDLSPSFDEWLLVERPGHREAILAASIEAIENDDLQDMKHARLILRSLDRLDPDNEALARLGMRLDHAAGDRAALHRRYRSLEDRLKSEFAVSPSQETRRLLHELLATEGEAQPLPERSVAPLRLDLELSPTVMVTSIQARGADSELSELAAFCADDIRAALSAIRGIRVLDARIADVESLAKRCEDALGLYLFSGSARRAGEDLRITLQLSNAVNQEIIWSNSLRLSGIGDDIIDRIVGAAAGAVKSVIDHDLESRLHADSDDDMRDKRALYTRARLLIRQARSLSEAQDGARLLEELIAANPRHLGAHLLLARMYNTDFWQQICGHDVAAYRMLSSRHMRAALGIAPGSEEVRIRQAWCLLRGGQWAQATRELDAVLGGLSHDPDLINECAFALCHLGDLARARALMQRAFALNPFPSSDYHADYAVLLALEGDAQAAEEHFTVSGERGMQYVAVRLANAARLDQLPDDQPAVVGEFIRGFCQAWRGDRAPGLDDVGDWVGHTLPFNPAAHLEFVRAGLNASLAPYWPAAAGNS